uniref:30S ribosomal protein S11 n=1 Tax=Alistipes putredinis TaxID=28117 RepID=UPI003FD74301
MAKKTGTVKKKVVKVGAVGMAYVHSTFNNVIITITNEVGDVISWSSAGKMGFRGSKKNTPYAAQTASADCAKVAYDMGLRKVKVYVKGPGATLANNIGINISACAKMIGITFAAFIFRG